MSQQPQGILFAPAEVVFEEAKKQGLVGQCKRTEVVTVTNIPAGSWAVRPFHTENMSSYKMRAEQVETDSLVVYRECGVWLICANDPYFLEYFQPIPDQPGQYRYLDTRSQQYFNGFVKLHGDEIIQILPDYSPPIYGQRSFYVARPGQVLVRSQTGTSYRVLDDAQFRLEYAVSREPERPWTPVVLNARGEYSTPL